MMTRAKKEREREKERRDQRKKKGLKMYQNRIDERGPF